MLIDEIVTDSRLFQRGTSTLSIPGLETKVGSVWTKTPFHSSGSGSDPHPSFDRTRRLVRDSEWSSKLKSGEFIAHPYLNVGQAIDYGHHDYRNTKNWTYSSTVRLNGELRSFGPVIHNGLWSVPATPGIFPSDLRNLLITESVAGAKSGGLQALVSLMEGPKTFHMFGDTVATLANLLHTARRRLAGDKREIYKLLDRIEVHGLQDGVSAYLQFRYGWRILLLEIEAAFKAMSEVFEHYANTLVRSRANDEIGGTISSTVKGSVIRTSSKYCDSGAYGLVLSFSRETRTQLIRGSSVVYYVIDEQAYRSRQLSLHFAPTVWELIPFSFVADWFVNVGDWLSAYATQLPGLLWKGGAFSSLIRNEVTFTVNEVYWGSRGPTMKPVVPTTPARLTGYAFERSLFNPAEPLPPVAFNGLNLFRCIDAAALVTQRMNALSRDAASWRFKLPRR